jgi:hypothetical protein
MAVTESVTNIPVVYTATKEGIAPNWSPPNGPTTR